MDFPHFLIFAYFLELNYQIFMFFRGRKKKKMLVKITLLVILFQIILASRGPEKLEVKYLPGLKDKLNFKHYSGYLEASPTRFLHYWLDIQTDMKQKDRQTHPFQVPGIAKRPRSRAARCLVQWWTRMFKHGWSPGGIRPILGKR